MIVDKAGLRLLVLLRTLYEADRPGLTIPELVERTGKSRATVYRDLYTIRASAWPLREWYSKEEMHRVYYSVARSRTVRGVP